MNSFPRLVGLAAIGLCVSFGSLFAQNLFVNGSFESVAGYTPPYPQDQGFLPDHWTAIVLTNDTYSNDGSFGLQPGTNGYGRWITLTTAFDGGKFVAGGLDAESFGQSISLANSTAYTISAYIAGDGAVISSATWSVFLHSSQNTASDVLLGNFSPLSAGNLWEFSSFNFTTPANASQYDMVGFVPTTGVQQYMGIDNVSLTPASVPEPSTLASISAGLVLLLVGTGLRRRFDVAQN